MRLIEEDCIRVGFCVKGQIRFCRFHGIDYRAFVKDGLSFDELSHIKDANLSRAMEQAKKRIGG